MILSRHFEAEKEIEEALNIYRSLTDDNRNAFIGTMVTALNSLATLHLSLERFDEAEKNYQEVISISLERADINSLDVKVNLAAALLGYGCMIIEMESTERIYVAKEAWEEALVLFKQLAEVNPQRWNYQVEITEQLLKDFSE